MFEGILVEKEFINEHLKKAPSLYVCVYLATKANPTYDAEGISKFLEITESDVVKAWKYWLERGVLSDTFIDNENNSKPNSKPIENEMEIIDDKKSYSPQYIAESLNDEVKQRLRETTTIEFGEPLGFNDIGKVFDFYDIYKLNVEVIEFLITVNVKSGQRNVNYMEKVARTWAEKNIQTVEGAVEYVESRKKSKRAFLRAFGQTNRNTNKSEDALIEKWVEEYGMSPEFIGMACERALGYTGCVGASTNNYADTILKGWKENNVKTLEDIEKLDEKHKNESKNNKKNSGNNSNSNSNSNSGNNSNSKSNNKSNNRNYNGNYNKNKQKTGFHDFKQRNTNYSELENEHRRKDNQDLKG